MTWMKPVTTTALALVLVASSAAAAEEKPSPEFDRLEALAGEWEGTARHAGADKPAATRATYRVVSNGSAVMLITDPGTPHEMVTMFHRDDGALIATHYCAAMNQPRMKAVLPPRSPGQLAFEFLDGTNLGAHPGRMQRLVLTFTHGDHHRQEWTYRGDGKEATMTFELKRKP
jgi:hypothetical protein